MFYEGRLKDGFVSDRPMDEPLTKLANVRHRTIFFDMVHQNAREQESHSSKSNLSEVKMTICLLKHIMEVAGNGRLEPLSGKIGIVTPYKAQVKDL